MSYDDHDNTHFIDKKTVPVEGKQQGQHSISADFYKNYHY